MVLFWLRFNHNWLVRIEIWSLEYNVTIVTITCRFCRFGFCSVFQSATMSLHAITNRNLQNLHVTVTIVTLYSSHQTFIQTDYWWLKLIQNSTILLMFSKVSGPAQVEFVQNLNKFNCRSLILHQRIKRKCLCPNLFVFYYFNVLYFEWGLSRNWG